ncbi:MAG: sensor histidine kinase [Rhodospirillales bacterium]
MRAFIDAVPAQVAIIDPTGRILQVNEAWRRFAVENGHRGTAFEGLNYLDLCSRTQGAEATSAHDVAQAIRELVEGKRDRFVCRYDCHAPSEKRWFRLEGVRCEDGVALFHIRESEPCHKDRSLDDFAGALECLAELSDDLKVPLAAIIREAERMNDGDGEKAARGIIASARALESMLDGAADLGIGVANPADGEDSLVDVGHLIEETLRLTADLARERGVVVNARVETVPRLLCNRRRVYQTIVAMISRGIIGADKGDDVKVSARANAARGVEIDVSTSGNPDASTHRLIGGRFRLPLFCENTHGDFGRSEMALGLGRLCMESHGGALALSARGSGSAVTAVFPTWRSRP